MLDSQYRETRRREWDEAGRRYDGLSTGPLSDLMRQASEQIFTEAELGPGQVVLDVGTGPGDPALEAATLVAPGGRVVGIDSAPSMIAAARRRADEAGIFNVDFAEMDAEALAFPDMAFDAIISRYGFPHFTDAVRAFAESLRVLRPGGRLAAAMHGAVERNPYFTAPVLALKRYHDDPAPITDRGPFYFHTPERLEAAMRKAGFGSARAFAHDTRLVIDDFEAYWWAQKAGGASVRRAIDAVPEGRRAEAEQAALDSMAEFVTGNRAVFPAQIVIGVAVREVEAKR